MNKIIYIGMESIAQISHYAVLSLDMALRQIRSLDKHRLKKTYLAVL